MTINDRIRQLDDERREWERQSEQDERRAEAKRLRERSEVAEEEGAAVYAEHLRKRAVFLTTKGG